MAHRTILLNLLPDLILVIVIYLHTWHPRFLSYVDHHIPGLFLKLAILFTIIPLEQWLDSYAKQIRDMPVDLETLVPAHWEFQRICLFVLYHSTSAERRYQQIFKKVAREGISAEKRTRGFHKMGNPNHTHNPALETAALETAVLYSTVSIPLPPAGLRALRSFQLVCLGMLRILGLLVVTALHDLSSSSKIDVTWRTSMSTPQCRTSTNPSIS
ncbi:hypothetical protein BJ875DRAFT_523749 [Amylocarpus encephaloides]|uniref:Uncharacterized protein n=1 Tax=Amylocarpus encephaloides TaxID=45428 RepID=A0A9P7YN22_9HELO|nr:hypothetical protein BJ875DRAFT_523749 [Amylocarpus encephaloides]